MIGAVVHTPTKNNQEICFIFDGCYISSEKTTKTIITTKQAKQKRTNSGGADEDSGTFCSFLSGSYTLPSFIYCYPYIMHELALYFNITCA